MNTVEHQLIRSMMTHQSVRHMARDRNLTPQHFADRDMAAAFEAITRLDADHRPPTVISLPHELDRMGKAGDLIMAMIPAVETYTGDTPEAVAGYHMDMVMDAYRVRTFTDAANTVVSRLANEPTMDPISELRSLFTEKQQAAHRAGILDDLVDAYMAQKESEWAGDDIGIISTGYRSIDHRINGGFRRGQLIVVGARPGMGKTVFGLQLAISAAERGRMAAVYSAEMMTDELLDRIGASTTGVAAGIVQSGSHVTDPHHLRELDRYRQIMQARVRYLPLLIDEKDSPTVAYIRESLEQHPDVQIAVVDYISLMGDTTRGNSEEARISQIIRSLQALAKAMNIVIVVLVQLNRQVEATPPYEPTLAHLRDSGSLEAAANVVMLLYRREYYVEQGLLEPNRDRSEHIQINIAKARSGRPGLVTLKWDGNTYSIKEFPR